jgi:hypothetical protein
MEIKCIAGFSVMTKQPDASASLYQEALGLPLERQDDYRFVTSLQASITSAYGP